MIDLFRLSYYECFNRSNDRDEIARVENPIYVLFVQARSSRVTLPIFLP